MLRGTHGAHGPIDGPSPDERAVAVRRMCNGCRQGLRHATAHNQSHAGHSFFFTCLATAPRARLPREGVSETSSDFALVLAPRPHLVLLEEPRLMGEHDRLYAIAEVELLKNVRDVRLHGGLADVELVPDLRVREAASHQAKDISFAITELVELLGRSRT
jgi:hypothetical protein